MLYSVLVGSGSLRLGSGMGLFQSLGSAGHSSSIIWMLSTAQEVGRVVWEQEFSENTQWLSVPDCVRCILAPLFVQLVILNELRFMLQL